MFTSTVTSLTSIILIMIAVNFLSNELPPSIANRYFSILTFPGLNAVTGLTALSVIMALIGGFIIYMARSSLGRREFTGLSSIIIGGIIMFVIAIISLTAIFIIYESYAKLPTMMGPLLLGTSSLILSIILLIIALIFSIMALGLSKELRRRYAPRRVKRQRPPPQT
jgi:uncharacterized membrane protein